MREKFPTEVIRIGIPYRQETVCGKFPIVVIRIGVSYRQETIREWFPIEMKHYAQHTDRKL